MTQHVLRGPTFCADCGGPISAAAVRCRRCAVRARPRTTPCLSAPPTSLASRPHNVSWIGGNGRRHNNVRLVKALDVPVVEIRAILDTADTK